MVGAGTGARSGAAACLAAAGHPPPAASWPVMRTGATRSVAAHVGCRALPASPSSPSGTAPATSSRWRCQPPRAHPAGRDGGRARTGARLSPEPRGSGLRVVASRRFLSVAPTGRSHCADPAGLIFQRVRRESISLASFSLAPQRSLWDKEEPCSEARAIFSFSLWGLPSASECAERKSRICEGITPTGAAPRKG